MQTVGKLVRNADLVGAALFLTVIGATLHPAPAMANDKVTLRLDWTLDGYHLPFVWALDKGYYAHEGLDVKILEGRGSGNTAQLIGAKTNTFGEVDASRAALARGQGAPIKVVGSFLQRSQGVVVSFASSGINKPKDLIGKTVATSAGSSSTVLFSAMLKASRIPESKVHIVNVSSTAKQASLLQHRVDAITGLLGDECVGIKEKSPGVKVNCMLVANYGIHALGVGIIANDATVKDNPGLVRRFVKASVKGWVESMKHPAEAAKIGKKYFPLANAKLLQAKFEAIFPLIHTKNSMGHPLGWMAKEDWRNTIGMLKSYMKLQSTAPVSDYYTNQFIPK